jgi:aminoglycoside N3'-acetyltransferase
VSCSHSAQQEKVDKTMASGKRKTFKPLPQQDIEIGLRTLGLGSGDAVEVHSSLSSFGHVQGGANTVIAALMRVVGQDGALVMSAYPVSLPIPLTAEEQARGIIWKVRKLAEDDEKTGMGAIADTFRQRPDVISGPCPSRVCAWGRDAQLHSQGYEHLLDLDGWALLIGVNIHRCSSMHVAEHVPIPEKIIRIFEVPDDIRRDYPDDKWAVGYGSAPNDAWMIVWAEAERRGLVRKNQIGQAECMLFRAKSVVAIYEDMRRNDPFGLYGVDPDS